MVQLATKTLKLIEQQIASDQGAAFRQFLGKVIPHMGDAFRGHDAPFRTHLGASILGGECGRAIWYSFRWATMPKFGGRILRLFNRGHLEEARFIAMLLAIGCTVYQQDENGNQFRISDVGGHLGGSGDGVAIGIPDVPEGTACLLEFKTHNDASFKKLAKDGVRAAKFEHYVQMNTYMRKMGIACALYMAVNKNNDEIYGEIVHLDTPIADQFLDRGRTLIMLKQAPSKVSESPGWFACQWCDHKPVCHLKLAPERNCRTCKHSEPMEDGKWYCNRPTQPDSGGAGEVLSKEVQLTGCPEYEVF